jgi:hypothetical protein
MTTSISRQLAPRNEHIYCYAATYKATGQINTDQTGWFVTPSSRGNNYIIILYYYDSNHIFAQPIKNRQAKTILAKPNCLPFSTTANKKAPPSARAWNLEVLGHPQPPTLMVINNSPASGIANDNVKQKWSKAMVMRFYWIRDRVHQGQYLIYWRKGAANQGDYPSKHHPTKHYRPMRPHYLHVLDARDNFYEC